VMVETKSFKKTESLTQKCVCVGCQLNSDQTLGLLCSFKGCVRACDSTLRRHLLTRSERILVYENISFFEGVQQIKSPP